MNKSALKKYAPQARKDFIACVTRRAEVLGLNPDSPGEVKRDGQVLLINGQAFPAAIESKRNAMQKRIAEQGFAIVMDTMAYTWFNRLVAIRYMELHGFLDHGYRVLSHPANIEAGHTQPEILDHIAELNLPGLDRSRALDLKLAGNRDEGLYREVLLAQCHGLHNAMPFLFESLDDATELLLPDGLLRTDSIVGQLVTAIDEADWQDVEIIGWLYQFYISEKKDQVIGKVVKSEDIPAATQLFTPNWIVKYLVQNSLGRLWLMANPTSTLATQWEYYIQPAEQTPEVHAQLDALIQARIAEDGAATLNPESLTLLDPACGSGHILVEAYDLLRDIYLERGYRRQDIPRLILEKNLYGLDIDDRAAQLAGFALLMKARADDRRLFGQPVVLNVLALQEAKEGSAADLHSSLSAPQIDAAIVNKLVETFGQAKTFGSLVQIPDELARALPGLWQELATIREGSDMLGLDAAETLLSLVTQAVVLAQQFDAVVGNPPYMGIKNYNKSLKVYIEKNYKVSKSDTYAAFVQRGLKMLRPSSHLAMITLPNWMFHAKLEGFRELLSEESSVQVFLDCGRGVFGSDFGSCAFVLLNGKNLALRGSFQMLFDKRGDVQKESEIRSRFARKSVVERSWSELKAIPGQTIGYWLRPELLGAFSTLQSLSDIAAAKHGMSTSDNDTYLRFWFEVDIGRIGFGYKSRAAAQESGQKWFPFNKGGPYRKWFGNNEYVVNWQNDGEEIRRVSNEKYPYLNGNLDFVLGGQDRFFQPGITWSAVTAGGLSMRFFPEGFLFGSTGQSLFPFDSAKAFQLLAFLNSRVSSALLEGMASTLHFNAGMISDLPCLPEENTRASEIAKECVSIARKSWDGRETSWDFTGLRGVEESSRGRTLSIEEYFRNQVDSYRDMTESMRRLENENNMLQFDAYGLPTVDVEEVDPRDITLFENPMFRYGDRVSEDEAAARLRRDICAELVSFSVGCMMGRYSLDAPGLIYAHAGNEGFDPSRYQTFPADDDGIVPITDEAWFDDDGANRSREFVRVVWGEDTEAENMAWLAESLGSKASESADDTIRRYLSRDFYKDHLQTYKKRPIYWLFSSGKYKAFEALVYLHRYNAGTLSRMRMEYVVPLQSRMQARIDSLEQDIHAATSSAETRRLQKQRDKLSKQLDELRRFDENLRHYADQRITLDLDDGVKVNYGKFGDLLAEVKAVTGRKSGE